MENTQAGFAWGIVKSVSDPLDAGRIKVEVPGMFEPEHPEWCYPLGWPGSGNVKGVGARYPMKVGAQVGLFFEYGDTDAPPAFMPAMAPLVDGKPAAPAMIREMVEAGEDPNTVAVLWENDSIKVFVIGDDESDDYRFVVAEKVTGSNITLNARDGAQGKSVTIAIEANTSISIKTNGTLELEGSSVFIQGRRVARSTGTI